MLQSAGGVSEVASVGGYVKEYQIDINPDAMRANSITLPEIVEAVRGSNIDVGAGTIEVNRVEYTIRGLGFVKSVEDLANSVIKTNNNVPLFVKDVASVSLGPEMRRGALDKEGSEAVGGVVVVRFGENPLQVIRNVKRKILEISPGLPSKTLSDGRISQVAIVPFYDRTTLIHQTLDTLKRALFEEILVTVIVVVVMVNHLLASALISAVLPLAVLLTFIVMKMTGVDANIMALSGIAIAIGVMVDMGIILCENILRHLEKRDSGKSLLETVVDSVHQVAGAVITSSLTTIISFLPVFTLTGPEGKLFKPVAFTKTFAVGASLILAMAVVPVLAHIAFRKWNLDERTRRLSYAVLCLSGIVLGLSISWWIGISILVLGALKLTSFYVPEQLARKVPQILNIAALILVLLLLTEHWLPLGPEKGFVRNLIFSAGIIFGLLGVRKIFTAYYKGFLTWSLAHKPLFLSIPVSLVVFGLTIWMGFDTLFGVVPRKLDGLVTWNRSMADPAKSSTSAIKENGEQSSLPLSDFLRNNFLWSRLSHAFPGLGKEFMPDLDEGSFLFMPTTMPHASIGEALEVIQQQDKAIKIYSGG